MREIFTALLLLVGVAVDRAEAAYTVKIGGQSYTVQDGERVTISLWAWRYGYDGLLAISDEVNGDFATAVLPANWPLYVSVMPDPATAAELDGMIWESLLLLAEANRLRQLAANDWHYLDPGRSAYAAAAGALAAAIEFYAANLPDDLTIGH